MIIDSDVITYERLNHMLAKGARGEEAHLSQGGEQRGSWRNPGEYQGVKGCWSILPEDLR